MKGEFRDLTSGRGNSCRESRDHFRSEWHRVLAIGSCGGNRSDIFAEAVTVLSLVIYLGILRTLESGQSVIE